MPSTSKLRMKKLRITITVLIALITLQGLLGNAINLFAIFPSGQVNGYFGFFQAVASVGPELIIHMLNGFLILALAIAVLAMSFTWNGSKETKIASIIGLFAVVSAIAGGILFVLSGFLDNSFSAQMGGSFIFAYLAYFAALYYAKE
ncbi:MAG: hypothetical protein KGH49_00825 [Candidatus Micrarchaeota archaeon]|nr:hypothetical protein [Candidatus Micrarchaeota archaeon]